MADPRTIAVLGAGAGAMCWAASLAKRGWHTILAARSPGALATVAEAGHLELEEADTRTTVQVDVAETPTDAISRAHHVILCVPADRLGGYRDHVLGQLTPAHRLLLAPGNTGGALFVAAHFEFAPRFGLAEMNTLPFVARRTGPTSVRQFVKLRHVLWAAYGGHANHGWSEIIGSMVEGAVRAPSVLQTSLMNFNPVVHPPVMLLNAGRIESQGAFRWYVEGSTTGSGRLMEAVDRERMQVQVAYGLDPIAFGTFFELAGYSPETPVDRGIAETLRASRANATILGPSTLDHRFLDEDVPFGLVPLSALASRAGVAVPVTNALITLTEALTGKQYTQYGFNAERLKLAALPDAVVRRQG